MKKTLKFIDKTSELIDSGWGQRVYSLEQGYIIGSKTNFEYEMQVQLKDWPELYFLDIPNIKGIGIDNVEEYIDNSKKLEPDILYKIILGGQHNLLFEHDHCYFDEWIVETKDLEKDVYFVKNIHFKDPKIHEFLEDKLNSFVGWHLRRRYWVRVEREDLLTLPEHLREEYWNDIAIHRDISLDNYRFIPDQYYFQVLDKFIEKNKDQKIYLSTDLPYKFYEYYYDRYQNLHTYDDFEDEYLSILKNSVSEEIIQKHADIARHLFDCFALSYCKLMVNSPSCFSMFASDRNEVPTITLKKSNGKFIIFKYPHHKGFMHNN